MTLMLQISKSDYFFKFFIGLRKLFIAIVHLSKNIHFERTVTGSIKKNKKYSVKRWVVERTNSWNNRFRKLFVRYEKTLLFFVG
jgi:hypothetical protein